MDQLKVLQYFKQVIEPGLKLGKEATAVRMAQINREAVMRSALGGSRWALLQLGAAEDELTSRSGWIWSEFSRVHSMVGAVPSDDELSRFRAAIKGAIHSYATDLNAVLSPGAASQMDSAAKLKQQAEQLSDQYLTELDLYVESLLRCSKPSEQNTIHQQFNFNAPVGAVHTGHHTASTQITNASFDGVHTEELIAALRGIQAALEKAPGLTDGERTGLQNRADDCMKEIHSAGGDRGRLADCFNVLATSVQAIPAAAAVYPTLQALLTGFGFGR